MNKLFEYIGNIEGSPKTTIVGGALMCLSIGMYFTQEETTTAQSAEAVVFAVGLFLLFKQDQKNDDKGN